MTKREQERVRRGGERVRERDRERVRERQVVTSY